jgi:hypothetical protein
MKLLSEIPLGANSYATPVAANGTLFICSQSYLWAVQKGATPAPAPVPAGEHPVSTVNQPQIQDTALIKPPGKD